VWRLLWEEAAFGLLRGAHELDASSMRGGRGARTYGAGVGVGGCMREGRKRRDQGLGAVRSASVRLWSTRGVVLRCAMCYAVRDECGVSTACALAFEALRDPTERATA